VNPADHDPGQRVAQADRDGTDSIVIGPSSPLGIEYLMPDEAEPLLDAYHQGILELGSPFAGWATACLTAVDAPSLGKRLDLGFVGLQMPATALADESGYLRCRPLLDLLAERDLPLFIHPGPVPRTEGPAWWPALVPYVQQMHAAWFAFHVYGRPAYPRLRVCFAALAGLAPLHGERLAARSADPLARGKVDPRTFVETSSYGGRAIDSTLRVLGADVIVFGSDRPYASPHGDLNLGEAICPAIRIANPARLLHGD
jgi:6-methylsalicylate decarboxylase